MFPTKVEDFNTQVCRHAGSYLQNVEAKLAKLDPTKDPPKQWGEATLDMRDDLLANTILKGAWNDTGVPWMESRMH